MSVLSRETIYELIKQKQVSPVFIGIPSKNMDETTQKLLREIRPIGIIFFSRNIQSLQQWKGLVRELKTFAQKELGYRLLFAIDHEGGKVRRVFFEPDLPDPQQQVQREDLEELSFNVGKELCSIGIDLNFAPVVDIATKETPIFYRSRCYGEDKQTVLDTAEQFITGMEKAGIQTCLKHFPTLATAKDDTHFHKVACHMPTSLWHDQKMVYKTLLKKYYLPVMVSHAKYPELDSENIASQSKTIIKEAKSLGSTVVLSDDLDMKAAGDPKQAVEKSLNAGCDLVLVCNHPEVLLGKNLTFFPKK
ncbi:MAG: hypothetical protein D6767_02680 [Candidatus Hydrogenedentota bacterium]|nr:MAG: hypothetical protein D6767_02680 [Candidatus Hydrogenedentota bacterium]